MFDPCSYDDLLPGDELSFALGKKGATRRKLANASGLDAQPTAKDQAFWLGREDLHGIYMHLHSVQIPHLAVFGDLKSHQTLPWFIFLQIIRAHRQAPLARLHLRIHWPSRLYGWRQTWTSACTGQLDLKLIATCLSFHIISYLVFILPKRQCRNLFIQLKMCFHFKITEMEWEV